MPARPFSAVEIEKLEAFIIAHGRLRDRMLLVAGTNVGFRITEILTWSVAQVRAADGEISREVTVARALLKGGSGVRKRSVRSRRVVLNERARGAIRDYFASLGARIPAPDEPLFLSRTGSSRPISRMQAWRILRAGCRACGLDPTRVSTHSLRKTFVRNVYDASHFDLVRTQRIVGHSSPLITARCLETPQSDLDDLVLGLAGAAPAAVQNCEPLRVAALAS